MLFEWQNVQKCSINNEFICIILIFIKWVFNILLIIDIDKQISSSLSKGRNVGLFFWSHGSVFI
jgi:hypothetical protein